MQRSRIAGAAALASACLTLTASQGTAAAACSTGTASFASTGAEQCYTVPAGVTRVRVLAAGAPGGTGHAGTPAGATPGAGGTGGSGALVTGDIAVSPGDTLFVEVGGPGGPGNQQPNAGWNGGGTDPAHLAGGGGGASDIRTVSCAATCPGDATSLASRLLVAAGGGGGGGGFDVLAGGDGGSAVAATGDDGADGEGGFCPGNGGEGATPAGAGTGAPPPPIGPCAGGAGGDGALGVGGAGGGGADAGAGAGGGLYGGGGGSGADGAGGGGGGAGSSLVPTGGSVTADTARTPQISITPFPVAVVSGSPTFATQAMTTVSAPQLVTVTNGGGLPLEVTGLTFGGANPEDFFVGSSSCYGAVAPGDSCAVTIRFAPQATGARSATLVIETNDPAGPAFAGLSGTGGTLPQGPTGPQGPPGPAGAQGPAGPQGPAGAPSTAPASPSPSPGAKLATTRATVSRSGRIVLAVRCPSDSSVYHGTVELRTLTGTHRTFGPTAFQCPRGALRRARIRLSRAQLRVLRRGPHRLGALAYVLSRGATGGVRFTEARLSLTVAAARR